MNELITQFERYLAKTAGLSVTVRPRHARLQPFLAQLYELLDIHVGSQVYLGVVVHDGTSLKPATFVKHLRRLWPEEESGLAGYCVITGRVPSYVRARLVERAIPFVVPGQQLYWPDLGLIVQQRAARLEPLPVTQVSPTTQMVVLLALNGQIQGPKTAKALSQRLNSSAMTMSRAFKELEASKLAQVEPVGRERHLRFVLDRTSLWEKARPLLRTPVRKTVRVNAADVSGEQKCIAGETALAARTELVPPAEPVYAIGRKTWQSLTAHVEKVPVEDDGTCRLEVWRYSPASILAKPEVDPFSLYLSLQDEMDERVQMALEALLKEIL